MTSLAVPRPRQSSRVATPPTPAILTGRASNAALRKYIPAWPMTSLWPLMLSKRRSARALTTSFQGRVATTSGGQTASRRREASRQPSSPFTISMRLLIGSIRPTYEKSHSYSKMPDFAVVTIRIVQVVGWPLGVIFSDDDDHRQVWVCLRKQKDQASEVYGRGMDFIGYKLR